MTQVQIVQLSREWQIGDVIGKGGFGSVYEATDGQVDAAAKFIPKAEGANRDLLAEELNDVPNIVPILESGELEDSYVIVMSRAERSLRDFMAEGGFDRETLAVEVLRDVATSLAALDGRVVHRDIKPENILRLNDKWCLTDFGIARYAEASTAPDTRKHAMSPRHASPEQWRSQRATTASDVYSLGVVAYEIAAGRPPFEDPGRADPREHYREQHLHGSISPLGGVPQHLASLIEECLYKADGARPSAENLLARLDRLQQRPPSTGLMALQQANRSEVARQAETAREESQRVTEADRREQLAQSALHIFQRIADEIMAAFADEASRSRRASDSWGESLSLGQAKLTLSNPTPVLNEAWQRRDPPFDVIVAAHFQLRQSRSQYGYDGRSHSLWYCDAQREGEYGWFETAFKPMLGNRSPNSHVAHGDPFALDPGDESAKTLSPAIHSFQVAWPFTQLVPGDLDEFIYRWANWFAQASEGRLSHPGTQPAPDPHGSWRMR